MEKNVYKDFTNAGASDDPTLKIFLTQITRYMMDGECVTASLNAKDQDGGSVPLQMKTKQNDRQLN